MTQFCFMCGMSNCNCDKIMEIVRGKSASPKMIDSTPVSASEVVPPDTEQFYALPMHPQDRLFAAMVAAMQGVLTDKGWAGASATSIAIRARQLAKELVKEYEAVVKK